MTPKYPAVALDAGKVLQLYADCASQAKFEADGATKSEIKFFQLGAFSAYMNLYNTLKIILQESNIKIIENMTGELPQDGDRS